MKIFIKLVVVTITLACFSLIAAAQTNPTPATPTTPAAPTIAPSASLVKDGRSFEMRTYYAAPGKLEDLHARFRNHTVRLFKKHGMEIVGFWGPTDKEKGADNTIVYILAYPSREARAKAWAAFGTDPEWLTARKESEKNGKLVDKVESVILMATDYSPVK